MNLKRTAFAAGRWTAVSAVIVSLLQLTQTAVLARVIAPADFGVMAVAASTLMVLTLVADLGLSGALIHHDDLRSDNLSSLYWLNLAISLLLALALAGTAPLLGILYDSATLVRVLQFAAWVFPLAAAGQQFRALAEKSLRFPELARIEVLASLAGLAAAVCLAVLGAGVHALVAGVLTRTATSSMLAWRNLSAHVQPQWHFRWSELQPFLRFGGYAVGDGLANTLRRDADVLIGGLVLGPASMGIYAVPRELALRLAVLINPIVTRVGFPLMSQVKNDRERLKNIYLRALRMTASVNFPIHALVALFASDIVTVVYGPDWLPSAHYLQILAAWGMLRSIGNLAGSLLYATGRTRRAFWWNAALLLTLPGMYALGAIGWGLHGLAVSIVATQLAIHLPGWWLLVRPCCNAKLMEYLLQLTVPMGVTLATTAVVWWLLQDWQPGPLRLCTGAATGALAYLLLSVLFNRSWIGAILELLAPASSARYVTSSSSNQRTMIRRMLAGIRRTVTWRD